MSEHTRVPRVLFFLKQGDGKILTLIPPKNARNWVDPSFIEQQEKLFKTDDLKKKNKGIIESNLRRGLLIPLEDWKTRREEEAEMEMEMARAMQAAIEEQEAISQERSRVQEARSRIHKAVWNSKVGVAISDAREEARLHKARKRLENLFWESPRGRKVKINRYLQEAINKEQAIDFLRAQRLHEEDDRGQAQEEHKRILRAQEAEAMRHAAEKDDRRQAQEEHERIVDGDIRRAQEAEEEPRRAVQGVLNEETIRASVGEEADKETIKHRTRNAAEIKRVAEWDTEREFYQKVEAATKHAAEEEEAMRRALEVHAERSAAHKQREEAAKAQRAHIMQLEQQEIENRKQKEAMKAANLASFLYFLSLEEQSGKRRHCYFLQRDGSILTLIRTTEVDSSIIKLSIPQERQLYLRTDIGDIQLQSQLENGIKSGYLTIWNYLPSKQTSSGSSVVEGSWSGMSGGGSGLGQSSSGSSAVAGGLGSEMGAGFGFGQPFWGSSAVEGSRMSEMGGSGFGQSSSGSTAVGGLGMTGFGQASSGTSAGGLGMSGMGRGSSGSAGTSAVTGVPLSRDDFFKYALVELKNPDTHYFGTYENGLVQHRLDDDDNLEDIFNSFLYNDDDTQASTNIFDGTGLNGDKYDVCNMDTGTALSVAVGKLYPSDGLDHEETEEHCISQTVDPDDATSTVYDVENEVLYSKAVMDDVRRQLISACLDEDVDRVVQLSQTDVYPFVAQCVTRLLPGATTAMLLLLFQNLRGAAVMSRRVIETIQEFAKERNERAFLAFWQAFPSMRGHIANCIEYLNPSGPDTETKRVLREKVSLFTPKEYEFSKQVMDKIRSERR